MTTIIVPLYDYLNNQGMWPWSIAKLSKRRRLNFSSYEEVGASIIALDVLKKRLFYASKAPKNSSCLIIDLNNLEICSLKKEYNSINAGELKTKELHHFF